MRSNIIELVGRYQQALLEPHGIYIESILTTLVITKKFGQPYPAFDSSHQYGLTALYRLLMYVTYERHHWSLVCVFLMGHQYIVLRLDPTNTEMDQITQFILDHLKWTTTKGPHHDPAGTLQEDIRIDITVPHHSDLQDCGLRVLQYQAIIGAAVAQHPDILDGPLIRLQEFLR